MGRLFLLHDFSSTRPWLYALLQVNRKRLADQGLKFGPFNPFSTEWQQTHEHFFRQFSAKNQPSAHIEGLWKQLAAQIKSGADILLFTHKPFIQAHDGFWEMLDRHLDIQHENIRQLFIVGGPAIMLEQRFREFPGLGQKVGEDLAEAYGRMLMLTEAAQRRTDPENVKVLANLSTNAVSAPQPDLGRNVLEFLEREAELAAADNFFFPTRFQSVSGRQLSRISGTRWNGWKPLDFGSYTRTISSLDKQWGEDFASPLALRKKLNTENYPQIALLENKLGLVPGSFQANAEFLTAEPMMETLDSGRCEEFASALPESVREQLKARYKADAVLLSANQKRLYAALSPEKPQGGTPITSEFAQIGAVEAPIELTVLTMAYNHEKYIAECMDSVLMQKTDFPVRHIVLDHCSTDGTASIIRDYASKHPSIQPVLLTRRVPDENVRGLFLRCRTKFAALCDGDDYFYSPDKLQKQVDYLEARPHCAMCFHPVAVTFEDGTKPFRFPPTDMLPLNKKMEFHLAQLTKNNFIQTNSAVYRWRFREGLPAWFRADICPGDWYWHMLHAETGRIGFLPETMSVYRRHKKALYNDAFKNAEAHWRNRGLTELQAYQVCNDHFKDRYFKNFSILASGIFAAFFRIAEREGDSSLLDKANEQFPRFALDFYKSLDKIANCPDSSQCCI